MDYGLKLKTAPTIEPVSLQELKEQLRLDSGSFGDNLASSQMIAPGSQSVTVGYALVGSYIDVLGYSALVSLDSGPVGSSGTVDVKIQDSDDHVTFTDWAGGAFTQVTATNDNAIQHIAYTGAKQYIRVVARVLVAACSFGVSCHKYSSDATEDVFLARAITAARNVVETITNRALITQTWYMSCSNFPAYIPLYKPPVQSITSITYMDTAGASQTLAANQYVVDDYREPNRILPAHNVSWPSTRGEVNDIVIEFVCGYGATSSAVPAPIRQYILAHAANLYRNRESYLVSERSTFNGQAAKPLPFIEGLLDDYRVWF